MVHGQMVLDESVVNKRENLAVLRKTIVQNVHGALPQHAIRLVE